MSAHVRLLRSAEAWAASDPDPITRNALTELTASAAAGSERALNELKLLFAGRLHFGTAGLRAKLGPGPLRMNRVVVMQTSAGLAKFLVDRHRSAPPLPEAVGSVAAPASAGLPSEPGSTRRPSVVIGHDGRQNSDVFARDSAEILAGAGLEVTLLPGPCPTPLTSFATRHLGVDAGVMITASHNPPEDNGYKIFLGADQFGRQIAAPDDVELEGHIERAARCALSSLPRSAGYTIAGGEVAAAYEQAIAHSYGNGHRQTPHPLKENTALELPAAAPTAPVRPLRIVYTAMHGVGATITKSVFAACGMPEFLSVTAQEQPDASFPTLEYPNPEEPGALDLAFNLAQTRGADLVLAHDPDADRLAIAAPHPDAPEGYRRLSGNELGLLLGWRAAVRAVGAPAPPSPSSPTPTPEPHTSTRGTLACTMVSSPALGAVARHFGLDYVETLPGFKWVAQVPRLLYGFEESLGYLSFPDVLRDKDGISSAVEATAIAQECVARGITLWQLLDEASETFGHFASTQIVLRLDSAWEVERIMEALRHEAPGSFGDSRVTLTRDYLQALETPVPANLIRYDLECGARVMVRPSGTEPKLKIYLDAFADTGSLAERQSTAKARLHRIELTVRALVARCVDHAAGKNPDQVRKRGHHEHGR